MKLISDYPVQCHWFETLEQLVYYYKFQTMLENKMGSYLTHGATILLQYFILLKNL